MALSVDNQIHEAYLTFCLNAIDQPIIEYLELLTRLFNPTNTSTIQDDLFDLLSPFLLDIGKSGNDIHNFIQEHILPIINEKKNAQSLEKKDSEENKMLSALENAIPLSETNWIHKLKEMHGLVNSNVEQVSGDGSGGASLMSQQKLSLELLASKKQTVSYIDKDALSKAEQKLRMKQERRDMKEQAAQKAFIQASKTAANSLISGSGGALPLDEATLLLPVEKTRRTRDIKLEKFDITINGRPIVTEGNMSLPFGRRVGLVGRNGVGKSTLLRAISARQLAIPKYITILHVEQEVIGDDTPAIQSVLQSDSLREALLKRERDCLTRSQQLAEGPDRDMAVSELQKIYSRLEDIESDKAESRASLILRGLGFSPESQSLPTSTFSGGWRMRLALARALFCRPDVLLLDEPTNMLDIPAVVWLQTYLCSWPNTLLVVSHDREFLDVICTDVVHLHHESLDVYRGNYTQFVVTRDERRKHYEREYESNVSVRQHLQEFVDRWRYNASKAQLAQSKLKMLEKLPVLKPWPSEPSITLQFPEVEKLSPPIIQMDDVDFGYNSEGPLLLKKMNFSLLMNSRTAIVGPNGAGKTTFLKLMTGALTCSAGRVFLHGRLRFAFFSQHHVDALEVNLSSLSFLAKQYPGKTEEEYRRHLGSFGLSGPLAMQPIFTLSGGQKSRLVFATMSASYPHVLILDEPTNHLDVDSIDALIGSLKSFGGGVVVVSHDARFVEALTDEVWVCDKGRLHRYAGTIRDYVKSLTGDIN